jgi:SAM-dependent methyltransferase
MALISPIYSSGEYFLDPARYSKDAPFKAGRCLDVVGRIADERHLKFTSYADIGCGSGDAVRKVAAGLRESGHDLRVVKGYDVSPHVRSLSADGIEFICGDFTLSSERMDLVTLFDVFEHVPDPISFLKQVARRSRICALHIPLDDCWNIALRNMFRSKLINPGHLIALNVASALNVLAFAGLRVLDYEYTFAFQAPSGHRTFLSKLVYPARAVLARLSPYLLSRTLGGVSLMVVAATIEETTSPRG